MLEREHIREQKEKGKPPPWTDDWVLRTYRFCNVRREEDKVTKWLKKHWRDPYWDHLNLVPAMVLARMLNWPPTLEKIGFPEEWNVKRIVKAIHSAGGPSDKVWGSAYVVTTCGKPMDKALYVVGTVCDAVVRGRVRPNSLDTLAGFWTRLRQVDGLGAGFIAAQVVADLKHTPRNPLMLADDWWTWAAKGPGSQRGLNRYYGRPIKHTIPEDQFLPQLQSMADAVYPMVYDTVKDLCMQDWQNVMCEYDKYERAISEEGKPKRLYAPESAYSV
jgi:hypothetical protein